MSEVKLKASDIFLRNSEAKTFIVVNQGGTSSGKTYSLLQLLLTRALSEKLHISICSLAMPHLRKGALKDWIDILTAAGVYSEKTHNRTDNIFKIEQSMVEFFSLDSPGKAHGPRRDVLFINEANLVPYQTFQQLILRTRKQVFLDYNPADEYHWIYDHVVPRPDCTFIKSTYLDNPFLDVTTVHEIERLKDLDENLWRVYGEGNIGKSSNTIYPNWSECDQIPDGAELIYGLDFGYVNPSALVQIGIKEDCIYIDELLYESYLTNAQRIEKAKGLIPNIKKPLYADSAEPADIAEFYKAGFNCKPSNKDVEKGINKVKEYRIFITRRSANIIKEIKSYKWQEDKNGRILESPVKHNDHALDAMRYAVMTHTYNSFSGQYSISII